MLNKLSVPMAAFLMTATQVTAQNAEMTNVGEIELSGRYSVEVSERVSTDNDGETVVRVLGTLPKTVFCALGEVDLYRHGDSRRGALACRISIEGGAWLLKALGPSHEKGTSAGAAAANCSAICYRRR